MGAVENVANSEVAQNVGEVAGPAIEVVHDALREGVKRGTEVVHGAARAVVPAGGLPDIEDAEERAERYAETIENQAEGLADSAAKAFDAVGDKAPAVLNAVDPSGALEDAVEEIGETVMGALGEAAVEEAVETVAGSAPVVGAIIPSYYLIHGAAKTAAGATSLVAAGAMTLVGGVYGAAAAPFDGGASWGKVANTSRGVSLWGASVGAEGGLIAAKGAMGFADQVATHRQHFPWCLLCTDVVSPSRGLHSVAFFTHKFFMVCLTAFLAFCVPGSGVPARHRPGQDGVQDGRELHQPDAKLEVKVPRISGKDTFVVACGVHSLSCIFSGPKPASKIVPKAKNIAI